MGQSDCWAVNTASKGRGEIAAAVKTCSWMQSCNFVRMCESRRRMCKYITNELGGVEHIFERSSCMRKKAAGFC